jgi:uncharacterized protein YjbI with pentapeptide repeats
VTLPNATHLQYQYDADGRRVQQQLGSNVTNYLWDEASRYGDVVLESDGSGTHSWNTAMPTITHEDILRLQTTPPLVLNQAQLAKADLSHLDLSYADLRESTLIKCNFNQSSLAWADLTRANMLAVTMLDTDLQHANLRSANLLGARLSAYLGVAPLAANQRRQRSGMLYSMVRSFVQRY